MFTFPEDPTAETGGIEEALIYIYDLKVSRDEIGKDGRAPSAAYFPNFS